MRNRFLVIIHEALRALGVERLVLTVHDSSFPSGTPYGEAARRFCSFVRSLGFTGLQLGPQGQTSLENRSPYDGTLFSKRLLSIDWAGLTELVTVEESASLGGSYRQAFVAAETLLQLAASRFEARASTEQKARLAAFRAAHASWLQPDALFEVCCRIHGHDEWTRWPDEDRLLYAEGSHERRQRLWTEYASIVAAHALGQFLLHEQHQAFRIHLAATGLLVYGDMQVGCGYRDRWHLQTLFLRDYVMGAPPSRTTPAGQPWGFGVLDPLQYAAPDGEAAVWMRARLDKMLAEFDGLRIDHPHGMVCPWVYRAGTEDAGSSVRDGARLFESPGLPDHPELARYARVDLNQLDPGVPRFADHWVRELRTDQIDAYATLFDLVMSCAAAHGRQPSDVSCEVLSTLPVPLAAVLARYGLGRMRVTQKASLDDRADAYRSDNAQPADWIMVGNHDTAPLSSVIERWQASGEVERRAADLASRLAPRDAAAFAAGLVREPGQLYEAMFADMFFSAARNVSVFFPDLFGMSERYNVPGDAGPGNWSLQIPADFESAYWSAVAARRALWLPGALAIALRARGMDDLAATLEASRPT